MTEVSAPRVAFVIPARNAVATVEEAIRSALGQDDPRIEVVVVDDGSTDGTPGLAEAITGRDRRVRLLQTGASNGVAEARNLGVSHTTAAYLSFLDADDLVPPTKARLQAAFLDSHPEVTVVYSPAKEFNNGYRDAAVDVGMAGDGASLSASLLTGGVAFPPHCAMVRREAFEAIGGFDPQNFHQIEDTFFWLRLALANCRFSFLPMEPVYYRRHPGARSANKVMVLEARIALAAWLAEQDAGREAERSRALASRKRYLTLILAETLALQGEVKAARRMALRLLPTGLSLGKVLEIVRFVLSPTRRRWVRESGGELPQNVMRAEEEGA